MGGGTDRGVIVVGGGVAGLACAREILRQGGEPLVLESAPRAGGWVHSDRTDGYLVELGPQGFLSESPGVRDSVDGLGLTDTLLTASPESSRRYLARGERLVPLPMSPPAFLASPLLSPLAKVRVLAEPWARKPPGTPETIREFAARRIGTQAADVLVDAAVTGIFAGDPAALSAEACFPKMIAMERDHGGLFAAMRARKKTGGPGPSKPLCSFRGGMEETTDAMLRELGDRVRTGTPVTAVERNGSGWRIRGETESWETGRVVMATPAPATSRLLRSAAPVVAGAAAEIHSASVGVLGLGYARSAVDHPLDGYGFLVPGGRGAVLGCLFESTVFPERAPDGHVLLRAMVGGARNPEALDASPEAIVERVVRALRPTLGLQGPPAFVRAVVHRDAIPQYDRSHPERRRRVEKELEAHPGLHLAGAAWRGVSVNHLVGEAADLAARVLSPSAPR